MIVLDIETSGTDFYRCGIWQIGAIELENPENVFLDECRIDEDDEILSLPGNKKTVYEVTGLKDSDFRDAKKQTQQELVKKFFEWYKKTGNKNAVCQNPQFDLAFLSIKANKYNLRIPFPHRAFDLHSVASVKYRDIHGKFLAEEGRSKMGLSKILEFCGMKDNRKAHNALEDSKLTAECFSRIVFGKNLLSEFKNFPVPSHLVELNIPKRKE